MDGPRLARGDSSGVPGRSGAGRGRRERRPGGPRRGAPGSRDRPLRKRRESDAPRPRVELPAHEDLEVPVPVDSAAEDVAVELRRFCNRPPPARSRDVRPFTAVRGRPRPTPARLRGRG